MGRFVKLEKAGALATLEPESERRDRIKDMLRSMRSQSYIATPPGATIREQLKDRGMFACPLLICYYIKDPMIRMDGMKQLTV